MKILMIAYYFPPDISSGSFRPLVFARHLQEMDEEVYVLTAREQDYLYEQPKDYKLLESLGDRVEIFRARTFRPREAVINLRNWLFRKRNNQKSSDHPINKQEVDRGCSKTSLVQQFKDFITYCLSTPDQDIGWLPSAVRAGRKIINNRKIDVIYATGSPWTSFLVGAILRKLTKRPLIMDFRDPWVANPYFMVRSKSIRFFESYMERKVITFTDHIITNTSELKQDFLDRYPFLTSKKLTTIPNGFEEYAESSESNNSNTLTFTHAGSLYFSRNPRFLLQAIVNVIEQNEIPKKEIKFIFLGGIDISVENPALERLLQHSVLQEVVKILPRLPYREAVQYQSRSDILLLIQPDFPLQVPRKLYEYIAFRKPILGITNLNGATAKLIRNNELGIVVENQIAAIELALKMFYEQWKKDSLRLLPTGKCDEFMNRNLTLKLQQVLRECFERRGLK
ncbi:MAG: glycosyltransferase [Candidatus Babeliaceae bacterium]|nr:glycosyltransferase [Candidatus Babeliaceae bacterium]